MHSNWICVGYCLLWHNKFLVHCLITDNYAKLNLWLDLEFNKFPKKGHRTELSRVSLITLTCQLKYPINAFILKDLKDVTHDVHYENYRISCLSELKAKGISVSGDTNSPATADRKLKRESVNYGAVAGESEYEDPETLMLLQQKDQEIKKMQLMLEQMQQKLKATN